MVQTGPREQSHVAGVFIPVEHHVIPIQEMKESWKFDTESVTFSVGGQTQTWKVNECQVRYLQQFAVDGMEPIVVDEHDRHRWEMCIQGKSDPEVNCQKFCEGKMER